MDASDNGFAALRLREGEEESTSGNKNNASTSNTDALANAVRTSYNNQKAIYKKRFSMSFRSFRYHFITYNRISVSNGCGFSTIYITFFSMIKTF